MTSYVFIDGRLGDLMSSLVTTDQNELIVRLDPLQDGIRQIVEALQEETDVSAIHIISHGAPGVLYLGSTRLSVENLSEYRLDLSLLKPVLTSAGDVLLYGCSVASEQAGVDFVERFAEFTGADVAASLDISGNQIAGANWLLEYSSGPIEAQLIGAPDAIVSIQLAAPKLKAKGTLDLTYGKDGLLVNQLIDGDNLALQPDGRLITPIATDSFHLQRYSASGDIDSTFGVPGTGTARFTHPGLPLYATPYGLAVQADGKIFVAGTILFPNQNSGYAVTRFNADGTLDSSFGGLGTAWTLTGTYSSEAYAMAVQSDGKVLVAGWSTDRGNDNFGVVRFTSTGSLDTTFGGTGGVMTDLGGGGFSGYFGERAHAVALQSDGKIVLAGTSGFNVGLVRYNSNGSLDTSFDGDGIVLTPMTYNFEVAHSLVIQPDGKILVDVYLGDQKALLRYNSNGTLDTSFGQNGQVILPLRSGVFHDHSIALQADGKILTVGGLYNGQDQTALIRLNANGTLDSEFGNNGVYLLPFDVITDINYGLPRLAKLSDDLSNAGSVFVQPGGEIVVAGTRLHGSVWDPEAFRYVYIGDAAVFRILPGGISDQHAAIGRPYGYTFPADTFIDADGGALKYSAALAAGGALPAWLHFDAGNRTFSGTPPESSAGALSIRVTATDPDGLAVADDFQLVLNHAPQAVKAIPELRVTPQNIRYSFTLPSDTFVDQDGNSLTYAAKLTNGLPLPISSTFNGVTRAFEGAYDALFQGLYEVEVTASDGQLESSTTFLLKMGTFGTDQDDVMTASIQFAGSYVEGGGGNDQLLGLGESDRLDGGLGNDTLDGGAGDDYLVGGAGLDMLIGGANFDTLDGGAGADRLIGGQGDDDYVVDGQFDLVFENPGEGIDTVTASSSFYLYDNVENLLLGAGAGDIFGSANGLDNFVQGNEGANLLMGWDGRDTLMGGAGNDIIYGVNGADAAFGEAGVDVVVGGDGGDVLDGGLDPDSLFGENGNDQIYGGTGFFTDILVGGAGNDILDGSAQRGSGEERNQGDFDFLYGGTGNDTYYVDTPADLAFEFGGSSEGDDTVFANIQGAGYYLYDNTENLILEGTTPYGVGNGQDNQLTGNAQANYLLGGSGNDTLNGKGGNDVLFGESGADTFVFERGTNADVIGDFQPGVDKISLLNLGFGGFADLLLHAVEVAGTSALDLAYGDLVVLNGVPQSALSATDFVFA